ncbi:MAG: serine/threonine-protein kinase [Planctomycetota bacterium]
MNDSEAHQAAHLVDQLNPVSLLDLALEQAPGGPRRAFALPTREDLGSWFPDFEIQDLLGYGGMGCVYQAKQLRLDRIVAIKILPRELAQDELFAERFAREARAMARLNHPNVMRVHDFGQTGEICFLVMEFVDGMNLRELLDAGKLSTEEVLRIFEQVCSALDYAHREGVIHRDIKPENILLATNGHASLTDFGLARLAMDSGCEVSLTKTRQAMGTLNYMAPEQWENPKAVDHRADIYALGILLYELLTGRIPRGSFPPASRLCGSPEALDSVINKALQVDPALRFQSISEMIQVLQGGVADSVVGQEHFGTLTRIIRFGGRLAGAVPRPRPPVKAALRRDEQGHLGSTNLSLLIALLTCVMLLMSWSASGDGLSHRGVSLAILVQDVVVPNWVLGLGSVIILVLLRWRAVVHPFRSIFFATIINFACVCHLVGLVSKEAQSVTTAGIEIDLKLNVIPFLFLVLFILQQIELAWRMVSFLFYFLSGLPTRNRKQTTPTGGRPWSSKESVAGKIPEKATRLLQRLVQHLPWGLAESIEAESRAWKAICRCGCERSIWDLGGIRYRAFGETLRFLHCPKCGHVGWHTVVSKPDSPES